MATFRKEQLFYFVFKELMDDEYDNEILQQAQRSKRKSYCCYSSMRRDYVPKVPNYMGSVIREMGIPENIDDFRVHYRVTRHLFDILSEMTYQNLISTGSRPHENVSPEKKLLVGIVLLGKHTVYEGSRSHIRFINVNSPYNNWPGIGCNQTAWRRGNSLAKPTGTGRYCKKCGGKCTLPGVVGFLDGCHIRLSSALKGDRDYYNRKGYPSMHLQVTMRK